MALSPERIEGIVAEAGRLFGGGANLDTVVRTVRAANPGLTVTGTMTSQMADAPFREEGSFSLFLVDGNNHCWVVTDKPEAATAIIIAQSDEDDA